VIAGMLTFYLVTTALLTVRNQSQRFSWLDVLAMMFAFGTSLLSFTLGFMGLNNDTGTTDGFPPVLGFIFGSIALAAALGDARVILARSIQWKHRITRYSWRMCLALFIAAGSFFLGQSDEFPESLRIMPLLCTPVLLVLLLMFYWLVRVLFTQWRPSF
jgi:peptidoglycan/LPS O-acetylase OafA/YrhL